MNIKQTKNETLLNEAHQISSLIAEKFEILTKESIYDTIVEYQMNKSMYADRKITWDFWGGMFYAGDF